MLVVFSLVYSLPLLWAALAVLAYLLACVWQWTQLPATRWPWSVQSLRVDVFGQMTLTDKRGQIWSFAVLPDSVIHPACIVLHLTAFVPQENERVLVQTPSTLMMRWFRPKRLLILPDQADTQALQALRVWLKWGMRE